MKFTLLLAVVLSSLGFGDVLVLPLKVPVALDSLSKAAIQSILQETLDKSIKGKYTLADDSIACTADSCACAIALSRQFNEVVYFKSQMLGSKIIIKCVRLGAGNGAVIRTGSGDAMGIEGLDKAIDNAVTALFSNVIPVAVGPVSDDSTLQRTRGAWGYGTILGYGFPISDSAYPNSEDEGRQMKQILVWDYFFWYGISDVNLLTWDFHFGMGAEMGSHVDFVHEFSNGSYSPFLGGGFGIDYVTATKERYSYDDDDAGRRKSGFSLDGQGGMRLLRNRPVSVLIKSGYKIVLNDRRDDYAFIQFGVTINKALMQKPVIRN